MLPKGIFDCVLKGGDTHEDLNTLKIANSILPPSPLRIPLPLSDGTPVLHESSFIDVPLVYHAGQIGERRLYFLLVFREVMYGF